ncbi:hypothetical protein Tco_1163887 [Tanacetum coccineum]
MSDQKFADSHNMVAFLEKPTECEGFEQIVDFLNANPIKYALTVNPIIYTSCIEQFWATAKTKTVNGEEQLQALVDRKKVIITESTIRRDLQLEDADGIDSLPNAAIFEQLTLMGYEKLSQKLTFYKAFFSPQWKFLIHTILQCLSAKTTAWNKFSSTMSSAIIYLATNQKFNFSKYIFDNMVKNVGSMVKFWMYPRVGKGFSGNITPLFPTMMVQAQEEMSEGSANPIDPHHTPIITQPSMSQPQKKQKPRKHKKKDTQIPQSSVPSDNVAKEAVNEENVHTHSNDPLLSGKDRLKLKELMDLCTNLQNRVLDLEYTKTNQALEIDSLKRRVKKLEKKQSSRTHSFRVRLELRFTVVEAFGFAFNGFRDCLVWRLTQTDVFGLLDNTQGVCLVWQLTQTGVFGLLDNTKQGCLVLGLAANIDEGLGEEDASKQGSKIHDIDANEDIYLVNIPRDEDMFGVNDLEGDEVVVESDVAAKKKDDEVNVVEEVVSTSGDAAPVSAAIITTVELTLAQTLAELKSARPKAKGLVIPEQEPSESITTTTTKTTAGILLQEPSETRTTTTPKIPSKDKGKGIMVEEPLKLKKKDQVLFDQQEAIRLQAQFDKEERIAREKEEVNAALIAQWNDIQDKVETDYELAQRLQAEEQEELTDAEKATLFVQLLEKRRKHFAAKRAEEKRNRPPIKAQQRSIMCTYLKNMAGWKPKDLKNKSFATIQDLFNKAMKRKQKLDEKVEAEVYDAKEAEELKQCLEIVPDDRDDVTIDATPLFVKILVVDYKIHQEGKKSFFQIIKADGNSQMYLTFTKMLKTFDREDLEVLWRIVKARFKKTEPVNYMDTFLLLNLKTMFEHHVEDSIWKSQQELVKVLNWKLFDSCGVHCVTVQSIPYYLLVENMYPLTKHTLHQMFNDVKLQVDYECEMAYELLRLGRIIGIKRLHDVLEVTAAKVRVSTAKHKLVFTARVKLVLLVKNEENILSSYYCLYIVSAASTKVTTVGVKVTTAEKG